MVGVKQFELSLVQLCERQSAPLDPAAEIRYQQTFAPYRGPSVTLVGEKLREAVNVGCDWPHAEAQGWFC
jgi:hypothetical protein